MGDSYNFSQHLYCVSICFDEKKMYTKYFISGIKQGINRGDYVEERTSILYRLTTETTHQLKGEIMFTGVEADTRKTLFEKDESVFYADSVFFELYNFYQKKKKREICYHAYDFHSTILTQAITTHLKTLETRGPLANRYRRVNLSDCHFAVTLPTSWDDETQAEMIRPLFVRTGLITETDHPDKLLFFNQLQSDFRYLQFLDDYESKKISREITNKKKITNETANDKKITNETANDKKINSEITNGKKWHTCLLTFTEDKLSVAMDLFLVCYPHLNATNNYYDAKKLGSVSFRQTIDSKTKRYIELYIKIDSLDMEKVNLEDMSLVARFISDFRIYDYFHESSVDPVLERLLDLQEGFEMLFSKENFHSNEIEDILNSHADEIRGALIAVMKAIYAQVMYPFKELFWRNMKIINSYNNRKMSPAILILRGIQATERDMVPCKILLKWVEELLYTYRGYKSIVFGDNSSAIHRVTISDILVGTANQIKHYIQKSNSARDPLEIGGNRSEEHCVFPLMPLFRNSAPNFVINLDITFNKVEFAFTSMETDNSVRESTGYSECNVMPLSHFFVKLNKHQRSVLFVDTRMKQFMGSEYDQLLIPPSSEIECIIKDLLVTGGQNETLPQSKENPDVIFTYHQKEYTRLVLVMYLRYISDVVREKLNEFTQCSWIDKNVGYVISAEKTLLDDVFGSEKNLKKILLESGMVQEADQCRKARIVSKEEGILPIIQQSLSLYFPLRSYSVVVQLHTNYIQLTLHQVVKLTTPQGDLKYDEVGDRKVPLKNVSDIILHNKTIPIQDSNDDICTNTWDHVNNYGEISYCTIHKDKIYPSNGHYSLGIHKHGLKKLKQYIDEMLLSEQTSLNIIDEQQKVNFGHACDCYFYLSLRTIIDAGFKPCIQNLATTIVASLTDTCVFGNYEVDFMFVFAYLHDLSSISPLYKIYMDILQKAIDASIKTKRLGTQGFVFNESLDQFSHKHLPFLGNTLTVGRLHQSSSETYGIYIGASRALFAREHSLSGVDYKCSSANAILRKNSVMIILQKGQPIPITGCVKKFKIDFADEDIDKFNYEVLELAVIKLKNSEVIPSGIVSLDNISYDKISTMSIGSEQLVSGMYVYLEIQPNNYNSSLRFSLRLNGSANESHNDNSCLILDEPLTVAYF